VPRGGSAMRNRGTVVAQQKLVSIDILARDYINNPTILKVRKKRDFS